MLQGNLSVLNIQKIIFGFWAPKKSTIRIFPWTELSLRVFFFLLQIPICFSCQLLENLKKDVRLTLLTGKEKEMLMVFCVVIEEDRNPSYKKSR